MPTFWNAPTANYTQTTLNGAITSTATSITLTSTTNMQTPGYVVIDRTDSNGTATPNAREVITYTGISGQSITGCTRGADGSTARTHSDGAVVETVMTVGTWNSLVTIVSTAMTSDSLLNALISPVSVSVMRFQQFDVSSIASIARVQNRELVNASLASIQQLNSPLIMASSFLASIATISGNLNISGASVTGVLTGIHPTWIIAGFSSAATTNVQRLIMPTAGTFQYFSMTTRTPVSTASLTIAVYNIRSGASIFDTIGRPAILGGGTFVSTASIKTPAFIAGDVLRVDVETGGSVSDITLLGRAA